jgi:hypothetical protein
VGNLVTKRTTLVRGEENTFIRKVAQSPWRQYQKATHVTLNSLKWGPQIAMTDVRRVDTFTTVVSNFTKADMILNRSGRELKQMCATLQQ